MLGSTLQTDLHPWPRVPFCLNICFCLLCSPGPFLCVYFRFLHLPICSCLHLLSKCPRFFPLPIHPYPFTPQALLAPTHREKYNRHGKGHRKQYSQTHTKNEQVLLGVHFQHLCLHSAWAMRGDTRCSNTGLTSPETMTHIHDDKVYAHSPFGN